MTTTVNIEIAKLLKSKGFNLENCDKGWHGNFGNLEIEHEYTFLGDYSYLQNYPCNNKNEYEIQCPTIADVIDWLFEKHGTWISVNKEVKGFNFIINNEHGLGKYQKRFDLPTEAYLAAIEYCLTKII